MPSATKTISQTGLLPCISVPYKCHSCSKQPITVSSLLFINIGRKNSDGI
jgi:hypothetical protein